MTIEEERVKMMLDKLWDRFMCGVIPADTWDAKFIYNVRQRPVKHLSDKQLAKIEDVFERY